MATRRYSRAIPVTGPATNTAYLQLRPGANVFRLLEISIAINAASADSSFGLVRTATLGTSNASSALQPDETQQPAATTILSTGWSAAPTLPGSPLWLRRATILTGATAVIRWEFAPPNQMRLGPSTTVSLALWNFGAGTAANSEILVVGEEEY